jgi:hypothetical protein
MLAECKNCGELNPSALMARGDGFVCGNCTAAARGRSSKRCPRCGRVSPFERNHVHGRRNSPKTADLCVNCHRIEHAADWSRTRRGEGAGVALYGKRP